MMKIIVIDTDSSFQTNFEKACQRSAVEVRFFQDLEGALEQLRSNSGAYGVVLVGKEQQIAGFEDLNCGLVALKEIRKNPKLNKVPVILTSREWNKPEFAEHQRTPHGANAYFNKNNQIAQLEEVIESVTGFKFTRAGTEAAQTFHADVKLIPAEEILNLSQSVPSGIELETPISPAITRTSIEVAVEEKNSGMFAGPDSSAPSPQPPVQSNVNVDDTQQKLEIGVSSVSLSVESDQAFTLETNASENPSVPVTDAAVPMGTDEKTGLIEIAAPTAEGSPEMSYLFNEITGIEAAKSESSVLTADSKELSPKLHALEQELTLLRAEMRERSERLITVESKLKEKEAELTNLKERVRMDIRKIRTREKELESRLELLKKDSETLVASRENKILELKRKIDLLEFNHDLVVEKSEAEKENSKKLQEKMDRLAQVFRLGLGMAETSANSDLNAIKDDGEDQGQAV